MRVQIQESVAWKLGHCMCAMLLKLFVLYSTASICLAKTPGARQAAAAKEMTVTMSVPMST